MGQSKPVLDRAAAIAELTAPGADYELEEITLYGRTCRAFRRAPATLRALFEDNRSDLPFIVYEDERYTFEQAWQRASRLGRLCARAECIAVGVFRRDGSLDASPILMFRL